MGSWVKRGWFKTMLTTMKSKRWALRFQQHNARDQLGQIIWRLELCESALPVDGKVALKLARVLWKTVYGEEKAR